MNASRIFLSLLLSLFGLATAASARADQCVRVGQLAEHLQSQSGQFSAEVRANFRGTRGFGHLFADAQQLYGLSAHLRAGASAGVSPAHLASDVRQMERLVEDLQDHLDEVEDRRGHSHRGGYGHIVSCDTRCARRLLRGMERTLSDLDDEIADLVRRGPSRIRPLPYNEHDTGWRRTPVNNGLTFGGRGISIQLGR